MRAHSPISNLSARLNSLIARYSVGASLENATPIFPLPRLLTARATILEEQFDAGKPPEPPSQARINAIARLRRKDPGISKKDWRLIYWGLCDECGKAGRLIEDDQLFPEVTRQVNSALADDGLTRQGWFGLLNGYFSYSHQDPERNGNWLELRGMLGRALPALIKHQHRKTWVQLLSSQKDLLGPTAGEKLAKKLLKGESNVAGEVRSMLPISDSSWLWRKILRLQIDEIFSISDSKFLSSIDFLLAQARSFPSYTDDMLAGLLIRYERADCRDEPHEALKELALQQWRNPQVKSSNRWALVPDKVRRMVLQWFAKADLQHFFSLLQGDGAVDHARLTYWMQFVDQIGYTRIVMGADARFNTSRDFVDFRDKNKGRFSILQGGPTSNNAFVMRIGNHYFVEFSETGNACYAYSATDLPFKPEQSPLNLAELKQKGNCVARVSHIGWWQQKLDEELWRLGIRPGAKARRSPNDSEAPTNLFAFRRPQSTQSIGSDTTASPPGLGSAATTTSEARHTSASQPPQSKGNVIRYAESKAMQLRVIFEDHRHTGGAFWILEKEEDSAFGRELSRLGFRFTAKRGFWLK